MKEGYFKVHLEEQIHKNGNSLEKDSAWAVQSEVRICPTTKHTLQ